jgi:hypothetical protein
MRLTWNPLSQLRHLLLATIEMQVAPATQWFLSTNGRRYLYQHLEVAVTATSNISARAIPEILTDVRLLKTIAVFCALVLGASLCLATYSLDLRAGFF